jgi:hypothetical protein
MHEAVKEGYGGGGGLRRALPFYGILGRFLLDLQELSSVVERFSTGAPVCWGFLGTGARISI